MIRLLIVEGLGLVREGLAALLGKMPDIEVIGMAPDVAAAIAIIERQRPDVVVAELSFPDGSAMELIKTTRAQTPGGRVVIVTESTAESAAETAIVNAAAACIHKSRPVLEMIEAIRTANPALAKTGHAGHHDQETSVPM
jgi:DNA-binding NarL/FixJ family response regulator